jgi:hydrogenase maturation protease
MEFIQPGQLSDDQEDQPSDPLTSSPTILLLGIGNILMGDEGLGVRWAQAMEKEVLPNGVGVLDGGTGGFHLMRYFEEASIVIMVDACLDDRPAGTIRLLEPRFSKDFPKALSSHDIGLKDLVEGLMILDRLPKIYLLAVSIDELQPMELELSPPIEAVIPELVEKTFELLKNAK